MDLFNIMLVYVIIVVLRLLNVSSSEIGPRVVLGDKTNIQNHPYLAFLVIAQNTSAFICGASIINQKVLLTAAHCFDTLTRKSKGYANIGNTNKRKGYVIKIIRVKVHPKYDTMKIINDIALAGLEKEIKFGVIVNRVALAQRRPREGPALIAGWGLVSEEPYKDTDLLHQTEQRIWPKSDCVRLLRKMPEGTFCGGRGHDGGYPSMGDSGSPLIIGGYLQIGLVSFKKVNISTSVIVYTDVPYHYQWISGSARAVFCG